MTIPTDDQAARLATPQANDPALALLTALAPTDQMSRRRAFSALLRAVVSEGQNR